LLHNDQLAAFIKPNEDHISLPEQYLDKRISLTMPAKFPDMPEIIASADVS
jgi:hypothetical protein